jgi:hypothetical protein
VRSHPDHASTLESSSGGESRPLDRLGLLELFATSDVVVAGPPEGTLPADLRLAMGRGAILALVGSALPPPLADGRNALLVASGGEASRWGGDLASRLAALRSEPGASRELSSSAHATAWRMYRVADMARDWAAFLEELLVAHPGALSGRAASNGYQRPSGELLPPPAEVDGIGVLPVDLAYHARGVGRFPSASDYRRFKGQLGWWQPLRSLLTRLRG